MNAPEQKSTTGTPAKSGRGILHFCTPHGKQNNEKKGQFSDFLPLENVLR